MAKKNLKSKKECSLDEEMLMWTSYRYCIGRKTYVSTLAYYIANKYYTLLSDNRLVFTANDIREEIEQHFNWLPFKFCYDGSVSREDRYPYEDCIEFIMSEIVPNCDTTEEIEEKLLKINSVSVYHETYAKGAQHKYRITYNEDVNVRHYISQSDISDYQCWAFLASAFDKKHYKKVHTKLDNGEERDVICFESWICDFIPADNSGICYRNWPWHWRKVYVGVDNFINNGERAGYIIDDYVVSVEDYDATLDDEY